VANKDNTKVSIGHSEDTLYVLFQCPIPEKFRLNKVMYASFPLKTAVKKKDGDIFEDDYVSMDLIPPGSQDVYCFGVNGAGMIRDSHNGDVSWDGRWQTHQSHDDCVWTVEFAIPLRPLYKTSNENSTWGVNFRHGARQIELLNSVWAYQAAEIHPFARLRLSSRAVAVALTDCGNLPEGSLTLKGQIANFSPEAFEGTMQVAVRDWTGVGSWIFGPEKNAFALQPGEKKDIAVKYDVEQPVYGKVLFRIKDRQDAILFDDDLPFVFAREANLETHFIPTPSMLQMIIDLSSAANASKITGSRLAVTSLENKNVVLEQSLPAFQNPISTIDLDCSALSPGRYEAAVELKTGATSFMLKDIFVKEPTPEWLGNTIGISDQVLSPWTPLQVGNRDIACWGRRYAFGAAGFPSQVNVLGQDILAGPVRLVVRRGGKTEQLPEGSFQFLAKADARVAFRSIADACGLKITADSWMEYDGFVWNTITVGADSTATAIDGLAIEIPFKREYASLWWHPRLSGGMLTTAMGAPPQQPSASEPLNFLRLGDEEHGMQFFYETLAPWNPVAGRGQELIPGDKEYVLRYNLIGRPTKVDKPLEFSLGYMALPCRPRSNLFRRIDVNSMWSAGFSDRLLDKTRLQQANWLFQTSNIFNSGAARHESSYFNFWNEEAYDKDHLRKFKEKVIDPAWNKFNNTFCQYYQACATDANTPEYRKYRFEWKGTPGNAPYVPPDPKTRDKVVGASVCHQSRSYADFMTWHLDKTMRYLSDNGKIPIHGYQDCGGHPWCTNTLHGCPSAGHYPVLANREHAKRIYTMFKAINPLNQVYIHTGGQSDMNWCGFFDVMIEGEQFTAHYLANIVNQPSLPKNYTKILNLDRCRAQLQPYAWGPDRIYLWQFWEWQNNEPDEARAARGHIWGLQMVHDVPVWACQVPLCVGRALGDLGWDDQVEFIPYWRKETGIHIQTPVSPVVASAWRRGDGNLLAIVMNDSDQPAQNRLKIDFARFGFKPSAIQCRDYGGAGLGYPNAMFAYDQKTKTRFDPQQLPIEDTVVPFQAEVPVDVAQHSFKLIWLHQ
jgi:hypothetical protein